MTSWDVGMNKKSIRSNWIIYEITVHLVCAPSLLFPVFLSQGLVSNMTLGANTLTGWTMYSLSIDKAVSQGILWERERTSTDPPHPAPLSPPVFYWGTFSIPDGIPDLPQDTYIKLPKWRKACNQYRLFSSNWEPNRLIVWHFCLINNLNICWNDNWLNSGLLWLTHNLCLIKAKSKGLIHTRYI